MRLDRRKLTLAKAIFYVIIFILPPSNATNYRYALMIFVIISVTKNKLGLYRSVDEKK